MSLRIIYYPKLASGFVPKVAELLILLASNHQKVRKLKFKCISFAGAVSRLNFLKVSWCYSLFCSRKHWVEEMTWAGASVQPKKSQTPSPGI